MDLLIHQALKFVFPAKTLEDQVQRGRLRVWPWPAPRGHPGTCLMLTETSLLYTKHLYSGKIQCGMILLWEQYKINFTRHLVIWCWTHSIVSEPWIWATMSNGFDTNGQIMLYHWGRFWWIPSLKLHHFY